MSLDTISMLYNRSIINDLDRLKYLSMDMYYLLSQSNTLVLDKENKIRLYEH